MDSYKFIAVKKVFYDIIIDADSKKEAEKVAIKKDNEALWQFIGYTDLELITSLTINKGF